MKKGLWYVIIFVAVLIMSYAIGWIVTCGLIKLITMCFGWSFSWSMATGVYIIICILKSIFSHHTTVKK